MKKYRGSIPVLLIVLCLITILSGCSQVVTTPGVIPDRSEIAEQYKWRLEDIYATDELWEEDFMAVRDSLSQLAAFQGRLGESADVLLDCMELNDSLSISLGKLYVYANMRADEDLSNTMYQAMADRAGSLSTQFGAATSFVVPEILGIDDTVMAGFLENPDLSLYTFALEDIVRLKPHTLSAGEESIMALSSEITSAPDTIYSLLTDVDFSWPAVKDEDGNEVELSYARYCTLIVSDDRSVREEAYKTYLGEFTSHRNSLAALYATQVKGHIFNAKARDYASALEAVLGGNKIPVSVYTSLVDAVNDSLEPLHAYNALRKTVLKLDELRPWDIYVSMFPNYERTWTYEEAQDLIINALQQLGEEYVSIVAQGFNNRWIDVYATENKGGGAYSWGSYGTHPYILMNCEEQLSLSEVLTLAHEMGHSMHSWFSRNNQPYIYSGYATFVAEVASTTNEMLVLNYLLQNTTADEELPLLEQYIDSIIGTFYTQTRYAEFEKATHELAESGQALTPDALAEMWADIYQKYWGPEMVILPQTGDEWSRIPHFYYNFYVYTYATSLSAAETISQRILAGDTATRDAYLEMLASGSSDYPVELLKKAGVDMTSPEPVENLTRKMAELVEKVRIRLEK